MAEVSGVKADVELARETLESAGLKVAGRIRRLGTVDVVLPAGNFGIASLQATAAEADVVGRGSDPVFCRASILHLYKITPHQEKNRSLAVAAIADRTA